MTPAQYEVELKYRIADEHELSQRLQRLGVELGPPVFQEDRYFEHPCRDFAVTDEALRIRTVGDRRVVTYKGPKIGTETKTRREIEQEVGRGQDTYDRMVELFHVLGFKTVATVRKSRRTGMLDCDAKLIEVVVDRVERLGNFVELELVSTAASLDDDRRSVLAAAADLGLIDDIRTSYLQLLLDLGS